MLALGLPVHAEEGELLQRLNDFRTREQNCRGQRVAPAPPLRLEPRLSQLQPTSREALRQQLARSGFATVQVLIARGGGDSRSALKGMMRRYCNVLLDPDFTVVGFARGDKQWFVTLGEPVVTAELAAWPEAGREVLAAVNRARAEARRCGDKTFSPVPPLVWDDQLAQAALAHSRDMARRNYFDHFASDGAAPGTRVRQAGYRWRAVGENIAAGHGSPEKVVAGWLDSPPHCANIMSPHFRESGVAYAVDPDSDRTIYWTQKFGTPR